jgi:hypothetical protein
MSEEHAAPPGAAEGASAGEAHGAHAQSPSEEELRAAYEAELSRITSGEMILQTVVSLLNIGGRRLAPGQSPAAEPGSPPAGGERDLEQVRDAIDAVRALMPVLERRMARDVAPLRDALAQLQMAYTREARSAGPSVADAPPATHPSEPTASSPPTAPKPGASPEQRSGGKRPGPAESSGRLWVPGR